MILRNLSSGFFITIGIVALDTAISERNALPGSLIAVCATKNGSNDHSSQYMKI
jgi:hypothetical protein